MNENINLVEILKDCPKGTKLWHSMYGEVEFDYILGCNSIQINTFCGLKYTEEDGRTFKGIGDCLLFPSKDQRDWSKWKCPKPKFDPKTLKPFDEVLVRDYSSGYWKCDFFSSIDDSTSNHKYITVSSAYIFCIPYNDETKHLVGTTEEAPEYYRYWED